jgi:hypothetical protein
MNSKIRPKKRHIKNGKVSQIQKQKIHPSITKFDLDGCIIIQNTDFRCKPRGLQAARKLRTIRRENRWADNDYKKRALGTAFKHSPFGGSSHAKGIVLEKM